ncbi:MAG: hypothetical protein HY470_01185 [Candidatus Ryanbacteria bacterium]|nr:hypothetical protein [Candidatus Ryanbacteria bacterium]
MERLGEREAGILDMLVREYIRTAEPVSSGAIARRMKQGLSPATVRNIFAELSGGGFVDQPHVSGGRVPKARGYRFFVDRILDDEVLSPLLPDAIDKMIGDIEQDMASMRDFQQALARHFHVLSRFGDFAPIGFEEVFREPEFYDTGLVHEFGRFLDRLERIKGRFQEELEPESFGVYIGDENGLKYFSRVSTVVAKNKDGELFFIAGPTRMHYDRIISTMKRWHKKPTP